MFTYIFIRTPSMRVLKLQLSKIMKNKFPPFNSFPFEDPQKIYFLCIGTILGLEKYKIMAI